MIRTTAPRHLPARSLRVGAAAASAAGLALLAGCAGPTGGPSGGDVPAADAESYADGEYTAEGSYQTPESVETISVTVDLADDVVTAVEVTGDPTRAESEQYQGQFIGGISQEVVGKRLDEISVDRVAGSSLTSGGFMQAVDKIRADAAE